MLGVGDDPGVHHGPDPGEPLGGAEHAGHSWPRAAHRLGDRAAAREKVPL